MGKNKPRPRRRPAPTAPVTSKSNSNRLRRHSSAPVSGHFAGDGAARSIYPPEGKIKTLTNPTSESTTHTAAVNYTSRGSNPTTNRGSNAAAHTSVFFYFWGRVKKKIAASRRFFTPKNFSPLRGDFLPPKNFRRFAAIFT